jgi:adenylate cyclase
MLFLFRNHSIHVPMALPLLAGTASIISGFAYMVFVETRNGKEIQTTFSKYLSPTITQHLIESGMNPIAEVGHWKELSILFSDIRGFTSLSERIPAAQLVHILNDYLSAMTDIIFEHTGTLDKFIGDSVMAFWGAPVENKDHALLSVKTALVMTARLRQFNIEASSRQQPSLKIGIGIHTGKAIVGNIGGNKRLDYTVIGDAVNLASRIEGLTKEYNLSILISEPTYRLIHDQVLCRPIDVVVVKGKTEAIKIYEPLVILDEGPISENLLKLMEHSQKALDFYQSGAFSEALLEYQNLRRFFPDDGLSPTMIQRCEQLIENPPQNWQGIYFSMDK